MGMFDSIRWDYPLPVTKEMIEWGLDMQEMEYQTKDLDNLLEHYFVNSEGELFYTFHERKWVDDEDAFLKGYFKSIRTEVRPANYHGTIVFYCYEDLDSDDGRSYTISAEYEAKFSDNKLVHVELLDQDIRDETEYVLMCEERERQRSIQAAKWYNKYFFHSKPYRKVAHVLIKSAGKIHNFTGKIQTFLIRHL